MGSIFERSLFDLAWCNFNKFHSWQAKIQAVFKLFATRASTNPIKSKVVISMVHCCMFTSSSKLEIRWIGHFQKYHYTLSMKWNECIFAVRVIDLRTLLDNLSNSWFVSTWWDGQVGGQSNRKWPHTFCIRIESNSQRTLYCTALLKRGSRVKGKGRGSRVRVEGKGQG